MKTALLAAVLIFAGACSGTTTSPPKAETPAWVPQGATSVEPGIWAHAGMLYGTDCARMEALTSAGAPYGPTSAPGYGSVCW